jgi:lipopolysaccharide export system permease protein
LSGGLAASATRRGPGLRPTLIDLYLLRLLASRAAGGFAVIFTLTMLERSLRLATQMAAAGAHMRFLPAMIWNLAPHYVALAVPDAFLIGMLMTVSMLDEDLEIEAMLASGFSLGRFVASLVALGVCAAAVNLLFLGVLEPLGLYGYRALREEALRAGWTAEAQPWAFQGRAGAVTLTADGTDASGRGLTRLFVQRRSAGGVESVLTSPVGLLGLTADGRTATLDVRGGEALVLRPGRAPMAGVFERYALADPYPLQGGPPSRGDRPQELTLAELARVPDGPDANRARSEFFARIARTLSLPLLPFLALPMAVAARRERRAVGIALAGLVALTFRQSVRLTQRLGAVGRVDPLLASLALFSVFSLLVLWVFASNRRLQGDTPLAGLLGRIQTWIERGRGVERADPAAHATVGGYVRREVGRSVLIAGVALVVLLGMIDLFERTEDILARGFGLAGLVRYVLLRAPILAEQTVGLATLVGTAFAFIRMTRASEMVAVRSLGASLYQIAGMCLPVAVTAVIASLFLAEVAAPAAQLELARWWDSGAEGEAAAAPRWFRVGGDLVEARAASADGTRLSDVVIYRRDAQGWLRERVAARAATFAGDGWRLDQASHIVVDGGRVTRVGAAPARWDAAMRPAEVSALLARPLQLTALTAARALSGQAPTDLSRGLLVTRLLRTIAEPFAPLIMLLLAVPLALSKAQTGPTVGRVLWVLGAGLIYMVTDGIFAAAGSTGMLPPGLAAFFAPILFAGVAGTAFVRSEA